MTELDPADTVPVPRVLVEGLTDRMREIDRVAAAPSHAFYAQDWENTVDSLLQAARALLDAADSPPVDEPLRSGGQLDKMDDPYQRAPTHQPEKGLTMPKTEWPRTLRDISDAMYPKQSAWWFTPFWKMTYWGLLWPAGGKGGDEWGWHTLWVTIPLIGQIVVRTRRCDCDEIAEFRCPWPACPQLSFSSGGYCITHNREWVEELIASVEAPR